LTYEVEINGRVRRVDIQRAGAGFLVTVDGQRHTADVTFTEGIWSLILEDAPGGDPSAATRRSYELAIVERPGTGQLTVHTNGRAVTAAAGAARGSWARRGHEAGSAGKGPQRVVAPMPGKVVKVLVQPGNQVAARQGIVIVEAMKMENELRAPRAGTVSEVKVLEGSSVEAGAILVIIE
jgi:biotin carboxyl carrier protein